MSFKLLYAAFFLILLCTLSETWQSTNYISEGELYHTITQTTNTYRTKGFFKSDLRDLGNWTSSSYMSVVDTNSTEFFYFIIMIYDEETLETRTGSFLATNSTETFTGDNFAGNSSKYYDVSSFPTGEDVVFQISNSSYPNRFYYMDLTGEETNDTILYTYLLLEGSDTEEYIFEVTDLSLRSLEGVKVTMNGYDSNRTEWVPFAEQKTGADGKAAFILEKHKLYLAELEFQNYVAVNFDFKPSASNTLLTIRMTPTTDFNVMNYDSPHAFLDYEFDSNYTSETISLSFLDSSTEQQVTETNFYVFNRTDNAQVCHLSTSLNATIFICNVTNVNYTYVSVGSFTFSDGNVYNVSKLIKIHPPDIKIALGDSLDTSNYQYVAIILITMLGLIFSAKSAGVGAGVITLASIFFTRIAGWINLSDWNLSVMAILTALVFASERRST